MLTSQLRNTAEIGNEVLTDFDAARRSCNVLIVLYNIYVSPVSQVFKGRRDLRRWRRQPTSSRTAGTSAGHQPAQ